MSNLTSVARRIAPAVLSLALFAASCSPSITHAQEAPAPGAPPGDDDVIPPGQEELLSDMLGRGATLPGECQLTAGQVNGPVLLARYTCAGSQVVFELRHPKRAGNATARTEKFAVALQSGTPPTGLADALVARIRSREADFKWLSLAPPVEPSSSFAYIAVAVVLGLAVLIWTLRRRRTVAERAH